jgi:hypothetical protein
MEGKLTNACETRVKSLRTHQSLTWLPFYTMKPQFDLETWFKQLPGESGEIGGEFSHNPMLNTENTGPMAPELPRNVTVARQATVWDGLWSRWRLLVSIFR